MNKKIFHFLARKYLNIIFDSFDIGFYIAKSRVPIPIDLPEDEQIKMFYMHGYIYICNDVLAKMYGYSGAQEIIGKKLVELHGGSDVPENIEAHRNFIRMGYKIVNAETCEIDKGGNVVWFLNNTVGIVKRGALIATIGTQQNITERKRFEEGIKKSDMEKRLILNSVSELIAFQGKDLEIVWANKSAGDSLGLKPESLIGLHCYELWHKRESVCENCPVERAIKKGEYQEGEIKTPDGRIWFIRAYPVKDERGEILGAVEITLEITEKRRMEEELEKREKILEVIHNSAQKFLRGMEFEESCKLLLEKLGKIVGASRVYIFENYRDEKGRLLTSQRFEWVEEGIEPQIDNPQLQNFPWIEMGFERQVKIFERNEPVYGFVKDFPETERKVFESQKILSLLSFPIFVNSEWWGFIGFDDCVREKEWTHIEIETLKIAAALIGNAIKRKKIEDDLCKSEGKFRLLAEHAQDLIYKYEFSPKRGFTYVSPFSTTITGYTPEEHYQDPDLYFKIVHPDDRYIYEEIVKGEVDWKKPIILRWIKKNGKILWTEQRNTPIYDEKGRLIAIEGIARDITERRIAEEALRKSEEKYRKLFEESKDGIFISTPDGRLLDVNPTMVEMFGYSSKDELMETPVENLYLDPQEREEYIKKLEKDGFVKDYGIRARKKDGTPMKILETSTVARDENGNVISYRGIIRDITAQRKMEEQLIQSVKMEAIGRLAGGIAHDFNNILTVISGNAELLLPKFPFDSSEYKRIRQIIESSRRAIELTKQLMTVSKRGIAEPVVLNFNEVIKEIEEMIKSLIGEDVNFELHLNPELKNVKADRTQVEQVIINMVVNAREAMPMGGELKIKTDNVFLDEEYCKIYPGLKKGEYVLISISDNGVGMPPEIMPKIFEPFFTTKKDGTGLGLSTVYWIVNQLGGNITVYSEMGKGTTFKIYIPACEEEVEKKEEGLKFDESPTGNETILVVEDEKEIIEYIEEVLSPLGYKIISATSEKEVLEKLKEFKGEIHLLLTDIVLPDKSGPEIAKTLVSKIPSIKVLFMSGYPEEKLHVSEIIEEKVNFIPKPFSHSALSRKVREVLDKP